MTKLSLKNVADATNRPATKLVVKSIRNTTSDSEKSSGSYHYTAVFSVHETPKLNTDQNIRGYIGESGSRNQVHKDIEETLTHQPERFCQLNSGFCITAKSIQIDNNIVTLTGDSIIDGCQTYSEIKNFLAGLETDDDSSAMDYACDIRAEIIVEKDDEIRTAISISRNRSNPVKIITENNALGKIDDLRKVMIDYNPEFTVVRSETDKDSSINPQLLTQVIQAFLPVDLIQGNKSETKSYSSARVCLNQFTNWFDNKDTDEHSNECYNFALKLAPQLWTEFNYWRNHEGWKGKGLQAIYKTSGKGPGKRSKNGEWTDIANGIIFPMISALSCFVEKTSEGYVFNKPSDFDEDEHIRNAIEEFIDNGYNPLHMGRNKASYRNLGQMPKYCKRAVDAMADAELKRSARVGDTTDDMVKKVHGSKPKTRCIS